VFDSVWGVIPPPPKETLLEIRGEIFSLPRGAK